MKNFIFIFIAVFSLISCDRTETDENMVIGEWKLQSATHVYTQTTTDYSAKNIVYNFQNDGTLIVTGETNSGYNEGYYNYVFKKDYISNEPSMNEPKNYLVIIENQKWIFNRSNNQLTLDQTYVDGELLTFTRVEKKTSHNN